MALRKTSMCDEHRRRQERKRLQRRFSVDWFSGGALEVKSQRKKEQGKNG
jgi:hypothetical protein